MKTQIALLLLNLALWISSSYSQVVTVPIKQRDGERVRYAKQGRHPEWLALMKKRHPNVEDPHKRSKRSGGVSSKQNDLQDSLWLAVVSLGTPPQLFSVQYDTGSADIWVFDNTCPPCASGTRSLFNK